MAVIGGGPAGAIAARAFRRMGFHTLLIEARGAERAVVGEALPATTLRLLHELGLDAAIAAADALRCDEIIQQWSGDDEIVRPTSVAMVDRNRLDRALIATAADSGVDVICPARLRAQTETPEGWELDIESAAGATRVTARFLVDARGRRAAGSRLLGPSMVALCGRWRGVSFGRPQLRIAAVDDGWVWGAPLADGSFVAQVYQRAADCAGLSPTTRAARYRATLQTTRLFSMPADAVLLDPVRARDASCRLAITPVTPRMIRIGDCCVAMDPLSSQGVQSAIRAGLRGSAVVNTILSGGDAAAAIEFYTNAVAADAARHREASAAFYTDVAGRPSLFWRERASAPPQPQHVPTEPLVRPLRVRLSPDARLIDHPVIERDQVRRRPALIHPRLSEPVAFVQGVALPSVLAPLGRVHDVSDILAQWSSTMPPQIAQALLDWLIRHEVLLDDDLPTGPVEVASADPAAYHH
ncbi:flavin-dependent monooxygenase QhpG [Bradyrhizobium jicamae]|uniref:flavin-dependent monooxygenase QhpG n=1 Tax=Bradyrhizobium jicamae TaxID=280332 RepID=UPI0032DEC997